MKTKYDFTTGNIMKQLFVFSGPILLANLLQTSYQFIDSLWIGNLLGENALGAVAVASTIIFIVLSFIIGLNNAALTILSQQKGKNDDSGLKRYLNAFSVMMTTISLLLGLAGFFMSESVLILLGTPDSMIDQAEAYLKINFVGILFLFGYNFISTVLRSVGDSKTPLKFVFLAVLMNMVLDPIFISVFDWGIEGAAYATIVSQGFAFIYGLVYVRRKKLVPFSIPRVPSFKEVRLILGLGIPSGLQMAVISAGSAAIIGVVTMFGEGAIAGFGAAQRLDSLLMLPAHALGTAVSSMAGQNIGVKNWNRVQQIARFGVIYNFAVMFIVGLLVVFFAEYGVRLFVTEDEAVAFGTSYLQVIALCFPFLGINFILYGIVRAAGAMYQVLILNIISFWVLRFPLTALFADLLGEIGIAVGMGLSFVVSSIVAFLYYRFGKWRSKELFK